MTHRKRQFHMVAQGDRDMEPEYRFWKRLGVEHGPKDPKLFFPLPVQAWPGRKGEKRHEEDALKKILRRIGL
jgi:hypothetical protein